MELEANTPENKIKRYQSFVQDRLQPDLLALREVRERIARKIEQYATLAKNIESIKATKDPKTQALPKLKTKVNLGSNIYMNAVVDNPSMIFMEVGLGFRVEFTLTEAQSFIKVKTESLNKKYEDANKKSADIASKIKMVYETIGDLMRLQQGLPERKKQPKFL